MYLLFGEDVRNDGLVHHYRSAVEIKSDGGCGLLAPGSGMRNVNARLAAKISRADVR
jgi:hypothetical protein